MFDLTYLRHADDPKGRVYVFGRSSVFGPLGEDSDDPQDSVRAWDYYRRPGESILSWGDTVFRSKWSASGSWIVDSTGERIDIVGDHLGIVSLVLPNGDAIERRAVGTRTAIVSDNGSTLAWIRPIWRDHESELYQNLLWRYLRSDMYPSEEYVPPVSLAFVNHSEAANLTDLIVAIAYFLR